MSENRKVFVPGTEIDVSVILADHKHNGIVAIPHQGRVIVVFFSESDYVARLMSPAQAAKFAKDVQRAHQAINDDAKIAEMEKEFE